MSFIAVILVFALGVLYFLPTIVASKRRAKRQNAVFVLNLFLGWTLLGWVISLAWAVGDTQEPAAPEAPVLTKDTDLYTQALAKFEPVAAVEPPSSDFAVLAAYDPDVKAAVEQLGGRGAEAVAELERAFMLVRDPAKLPFMVEQIKAKYGAAV